MINALNAILDFLGMLAHAVEFLYHGLVQLFGMIPNAVTMLLYAIGLMPPFLLAFLTIAITLSIVLLIVGR